MASIVCECCTTKGATVPVQVETVVQAVGLEDGGGVDKTQTWETLSIDIDSKLSPPLPATLMGPVASQNSSAGLHLSLGLQDMTLLRGTSLVEVLNRFGCELRPNSLNQSLTPEEAAKLYRKSFEVKKLNYFISHCWKDERFAKVIALLMNNNLNVAMVGSTLVATALTILTRLKLLPVKKRGDGNVVDHFPWALSGGMLFFFLVFFTWHHMPTRKRRIYFLDKFCVHQADDKLKQLGVQSFAGFVAQSNQMLLLWSPEYFTRLWCTLELAALVKSKLLQDSQDVQVSGSLKILPLKLAKVGFFTWVTVFFVYATNQFNRILGRPLPDLYILGAALLICTFVLTRALRQYAHDRKALHHQMETFSVQDSQCSDDRDRRWVERSMLRWFEDLERCNQHIRQVVRDQVEEGLGPERHMPTYFVMPVFLVNLFNEADYFAGGYYDHDFRIAFASMGFAAFTLALLPLSYRLCYCFAERRSWPMELLINLCIASFLVLFAVTLYAITHFVVANPEMSFVVLAIPAVEIAAALWLQRRSLACRWFR